MANFLDIIGQEHIKEHFKHAVTESAPSHAYLIQGEQRCGKEFVARIFAMALQCEDSGHAPCQSCHSCLQALSDNHPDIKYISHEKPNSIGIDDVREQIIEDIIIKPYQGPYKIYIMNEAEKMTTAAQNALLKTLEEPPAYAIIMLLTTSMEAMLPTILSRLVHLNMKPVPDEELKRFIMKEMKVPDYKADIAVAFTRGNLGRAKMLVESEDFDKIKDEAIILVKNISDMGVADIIIAIKKISEYRLNIDDYLDIISIWYRDVLLFKATSDGNKLIFKQEIQYIKRVAKRTSYEGIGKIIDALEVAKKRIRANVNFELTIELLLLTIRENSGNEEKE